MNDLIMAKLKWIEIRGFRCFGTSPQRIEFSGNIALFQAPSSQGKTSTSESIEFLLTGNTVRRKLIGSTTAEFDECLRNVHLPNNEEVYVRACIFDDKGVEHEVK